MIKFLKPIAFRPSAGVFARRKANAKKNAFEQLKGNRLQSVVLSVLQLIGLLKTLKRLMKKFQATVKR